MLVDWVCGVDEAGRGPLAGPVYAAAVILDPRRPIDGLRDSKLLSPRRRGALSLLIRRDALAWAVAAVAPQEIDRINILQATLLAMQRAVQALSLTPTLAQVDGNRAPQLSCPVETIVKGDSKVAAISAASILAKTERDREMMAMHDLFPIYRFDRHKGYPTAEHVRLLQLHGPCAIHRRSFAPVRLSLNESAN
jgi:ribonuclease HII